MNPGRYHNRVVIYEITESETADGISETTSEVLSTYGRYKPLSVEAATRVQRGIGNAAPRVEANLYLRERTGEALGMRTSSRRFSCTVDGRSFEIYDVRLAKERGREIVCLLTEPRTP